MAQPLIVEVLDPRGAVRARTRLTSLPATVGRGYASDVVLDDPYVCPEHLRLVEDDAGAVVAEDLASVNGLRAGRSRARVGRVPVLPGTELRVGRTTLRFRAPDEAVAPTLRDAAADGTRLVWLESAGVCLATVGVVYLLFVADTWAGTYEKANAAGILATPLRFGAVLMLWAGIWALANRAAAHHFNFVRHLAVAAVAAVVFRALTSASEWIEFVAPDLAAISIVVVLAFAALGGALLYSHLTVIATLNRRARRRWAAGVTAGMLTLAGVSAMASHDDFSNRLEEAGTVKPVRARWTRSESTASFAHDAAKLQAKADTLATREP